VVWRVGHGHHLPTSALPHFPDISIFVCARAEAAEARTITLIVMVFSTRSPGTDPVIRLAHTLGPAERSWEASPTKQPLV
jgi:hypothetical protein